MSSWISSVYTSVTSKSSQEGFKYIAAPLALGAAVLTARVAYNMIVNKESTQVNKEGTFQVAKTAALVGGTAAGVAGVTSYITGGNIFSSMVKAAGVSAGTNIALSHPKALHVESKPLAKDPTPDV